MTRKDMKVAARFYKKNERQMQFKLSVLQQQKGTLSIWLVKLQYSVFALWTSYYTQEDKDNYFSGTWLHWYSMRMKM